MGLDVWGNLYLGVYVPREKLYTEGVKVLRCRYCREEQTKGKHCIECGGPLVKAVQRISTDLQIAVQCHEFLSITDIADQDERDPEHFFIGIRLSGTESIRSSSVPHTFVSMTKLEEARGAVQPELDRLGLGEATLLNLVSLSY
jgi:hypothetical protein